MALFPPNSSKLRPSLSPTAAPTAFPILVEPVAEISGIRLSFAIHSPNSLPPITRLLTPSGTLFSINTSVIALIPVGSILFVGAGLLGAGTLKDLSLALFIGMIVGAYSSIFIAPPVLAQLREKEPAMQALAKRVAARGGADSGSTSVAAKSERPAIRPSTGKGPRNQPKRKGRK